jgi:hypothetical protein
VGTARRVHRDTYQFEAIKVTHEWAGTYAYNNTFDHNAILGRTPD